MKSLDQQDQAVALPTFQNKRLAKRYRTGQLSRVEAEALDIVWAQSRHCMIRWITARWKSLFHYQSHQ
jgi:hypothetical protein